MVFLESLLAAVLFALFCKNALIKKPVPFYIGAAVIAVLTAGLHLIGIKFTGFFGNYIYPVFDRAALGTAFFVLVMYAGAFPRKSAPVKLLMPVRGQLSILAGILTLGHNIGYGSTYFVRLFTDSSLPLTQRLAAVCSVCMLLIMLPLWITSFRSVRKKLKPLKWKKLQRHAYGFYGLLYIHVMLLEIPAALRGTFRCAVNAGVYTAVFGTYLAFRLLRTAEKRKNAVYLVRRVISAACAVMIGAAASVCLTAAGTTALQAEAEPASAVSEISESGTSETAITETGEADEAVPAVLQDGAFSGTAFGYEGDITVTLTIENGQVTGGEITDYSDDPDYRREAEQMLDRFLGSPEGEADAVSGATFTSKGILKACAAALEASRNAGE